MNAVERTTSFRQCFCKVGYWWSDNWLLVVTIVGSVVGGIPVLAGLLCLILAFAKGPR